MKMINFIDFNNYFALFVHLFISAYTCICQVPTLLLNVVNGHFDQICTDLLVMLGQILTAVKQIIVNFK